MMDTDIVVIGGGSAGYSAANTAEQLGARVTILDPGPLGGLCILRGCMPTKAILRSSNVISLMRRAREFGLLPVTPQADLAWIIDRKNKLIGEFADYRIEQLKNQRFNLIESAGSFISPNTVQVDGGKALTAKNFIIATGSVVADYPIPGLEDAGYLTSDDVVETREMPKSMIVLGAGAVAVELAQFFQRIGTRVSLIQRSGHILSQGDEDLARPVEERFREEGMEVFTDTKILRVEKNGDERTVFFSHEGNEKSVQAEAILMALGRRPNIDGLNLQAAGVETIEGKIVVDNEMRTSQSNIFAVGDVNGLHEIVHIAIQHGEVAAYNAVFPEKPQKFMDDRLKTSVVFTDPAVANVGLDEKECQAQGIEYFVASYPFDDHGKSMTLGETHGHVKILCDGKGEVIGGHIVGAEAGELIHQLITLMHFHGTVHDLAGMPHYHPTLSEILTYPAEDLIDQIAEQ